MITAIKLDDGEWEASTVSTPFMVVQGNTELIVIGIIERMLVWYEDRRVERLRKESEDKEAEVVEIGIDNKRLVAAPEEVMNFSEIA